MENIILETIKATHTNFDIYLLSYLLFDSEYIYNDP